MKCTLFNEKGLLRYSGNGKLSLTVEVNFNITLTEEEQHCGKKGLIVGIGPRDEKYLYDFGSLYSVIWVNLRK